MIRAYISIAGIILYYGKTLNPLMTKGIFKWIIGKQARKARYVKQALQAIK